MDRKTFGNHARDMGGMESQGILCAKEALLRPFCCMAANAGFNPLEKLAEVNAAQKNSNSSNYSFDCENGKIADMLIDGVVDPAFVKTYAFKAAAEVATAVLRINSVIKMRETESNMNILE